jgi:hypothetical protein
MFQKDEFANPTPPQQTEEDVLEIPRFPSPTATGSKSMSYRPFSMLNADRPPLPPPPPPTRTPMGPASSGRQSCGSPGQGKTLGRKFFRVVITLHVGYLVDECFGKHSDWKMNLD